MLKIGFKKIFCLLLVMIFSLLAFAGCSSYENDTERIVGKWVGIADFGEISGLKREIFIEMTLEFKKDGTAKYYFDTDNMKKALKKPLGESIEEQFDMSVKEWEKQTGLNLDDYVEETVETYSEYLSESFGYSLKKSILMINGAAVEYEFDGDDNLIIVMSSFGKVEFERVKE
ncbi:MAG: hypothetical protein E7562_07335 [Ruminococcaceae bacterium]|nr:hypothetical protein [Oscillospiraceae bacterium]